MEPINITNILEILITLAVMLISAFLVPWLKKKVGAEDMGDFIRWVEIGVAAAEQLFNADATQAKKQYVLDFLLEKGFYYNDQEVDAAIEAAVIRLHNELYGNVSTELREVNSGEVIER